nr:MAG: RNA-dependent RNA-polymerase [Picobirnavirus sp.]
METKLDNYFDLYFTVDGRSTEQRLRSYYGQQQRGNRVVIKTGFGKRVKVASTLDRWASELRPLLDKYPELYKYEMDMKAKVGPLSYEEPLAKRIPKIKEYYDDVRLPSDSIPQRYGDAVLKEWGSFKGIRVRGTARTLENMRLSTNSGNPYFTKRRNVLDMVSLDLSMHDGIIYSKHTYEPIACVGWRGQEGGPSTRDVKQRVVWMFPFELNVLELKVYQPLIEAAQMGGIVPAWLSMEAVDDKVTKLFDTKGHSDKVVCTDFTGFDQHFGPDMQDIAGYIISGLLTDYGEARHWMREVFPVKYRIPMLLDSKGKILSGTHGMASGSGGTNVDETLAHRALQHEAADAQNAELNLNSMCLGDDGILSYKGIDTEIVTSIYQSHGQEMQLSKQYESDHDCIFLRRWHHTDYRVNGVCVGVYPTMRALGRLIYQERYMDPDVWDAKTVALRTLSILENIKWHPMREEFVEFVMKRDKYRICLDIPHFFDDLESIVEEKTTVMPDLLGYTKSQQREVGIKNWWIVQYLKTLR